MQVKTWHDLLKRIAIIKNYHWNWYRIPFELLFIEINSGVFSGRSDLAQELRNRADYHSLQARDMRQQCNKKAFEASMFGVTNTIKVRHQHVYHITNEKHDSKLAWSGLHFLIDRLTTLLHQHFAIVAIVCRIEVAHWKLCRLIMFLFFFYALTRQRHEGMVQNQELGYVFVFVGKTSFDYCT